MNVPEPQNDALPGQSRGLPDGHRPRSCDELVVAAMRRYLGQTLGWKEEDVKIRTTAELELCPARAALDHLSRQGLNLMGTRVLDLGAGLGGLSIELARRGADVISIEPDPDWRTIAACRLRQSGSGAFVAAMGEAIPLAAESVDAVVSLQVLEHVKDPLSVLSEVYRVLRPGGWFYLCCENYLAFREQHYRVAWLPLLPKPLGALYLRLRGRCPSFLNEHVTYTTLPGVRRMSRSAGFVSARDLRLKSRLQCPSGIKVRWKRVLVRAAAMVLPVRPLSGLVTLMDTASMMFRVGVEELLVKPDGSRRTSGRDAA